MRQQGQWAIIENQGAQKQLNTEVSILEMSTLENLEARLQKETAKVLKDQKVKDFGELRLISCSRIKWQDRPEGQRDMLLFFLISLFLTTLQFVQIILNLSLNLLPVSVFIIVANCMFQIASAIIKAEIAGNTGLNACVEMTIKS